MEIAVMKTKKVETCATCHYARIEEDQTLHCHRLSPTMTPGIRWPGVNPTDWCGEYRPASNVATRER
jgi:hypothetical protein